MTSDFDNIIGQASIKATLEIYRRAFKANGRLPFLNFIAARGFGKTFVAETFRESLERPDGTRPPILKINAASIPNTAAFFEQIYPVWVKMKAFLFVDEAHNLPNELQEIFLTAFNVEKNPVRNVTVAEIPYRFDFREISAAFATTDQQKMSNAFRSRLRNLSFSSYTFAELYEIFKLNLDDKIFIRPDAQKDIISTFRGDPRDTVAKADDLLYFCNAMGKFDVSLSLWNDYKTAMGINPYGLEHGEIEVLKAIGSRNGASLTCISAATDYSRGVIQRVYEPMLTKKKLMQIDGKRYLSPLGNELYHSIRRGK